MEDYTLSLRVLLTKHSAILLISLLSLFSMIGYSQNGEIDSVYIENELRINVRPYYPGGSNGLISDIKKYLKIPQKATQENVHGRALLLISLNEEGEIVEAKILEKVREDVDNAIIKMTRKLKDFKPAVMDGRPVPFSFKLPLKI